MRSAHCTFATVLGLVLLAATLQGWPLTGMAIAAQPQAAPVAVPTELLGKWLEESSLLLVDIDLSKLDLDAMIAWGMQQSGIDAQDAPPEQFVQMASSVIDSLQQAGAEHLYLAVATRAITDGGPVMIIPCHNASVVQGIAAMLVSGAGADSVLQVRTRPDLVLVGPEKALDRLQSTAKREQAATRDDLIEPLSDPGRLHHVAVLSLADVYRGELAAIWPDSLPKSAAIELSPRQLAEDIRRIRLTWRLPPEPAAEVIVEAAGEPAARRVQESLEKLLAELSVKLKQRLALDAELPMAEVRREANAVKVAFSSAMIQTSLGQLQHVFDFRIQTQQANAIKQIGLAMHQYHDEHEHFPPRHFIDRQGQSLLSWRVAILPFLEQQALYQSLKLDQAWSSPANAVVTSTVIPVYADRKVDDPTKTRLRVPVFPGSAWHGDGPPKSFRDITDGSSNTIALIHAPEQAAVHWAAPDEWVISPDDPMKDVFGDRDQVQVLFFDGSVHTLQRDQMDNKKLSALLTIAGRERVQW